MPMLIHCAAESARYLDSEDTRSNTKAASDKSASSVTVSRAGSAKTSKPICDRASSLRPSISYRLSTRTPVSPLMPRFSLISAQRLCASTSKPFFSFQRRFVLPCFPPESIGIKIYSTAPAFFASAGGARPISCLRQTQITRAKPEDQSSRTVPKPSASSANRLAAALLRFKNSKLLHFYISHNIISVFSPFRPNIELNMKKLRIRLILLLR